MPSSDQFALFLSASLVLAVIPGPGMLYVAGRTLAGGRGEGVASSFGTALGGLVHVVAASAGLSALILASAELFAAMKMAGGLYLIWLGVKTIAAARREAGAAAMGLTAMAPAGSRRAFREGVVVEATNPKTAVFFLAFLPQFAGPHAGDPALQFVVLGTISVALNTAADLAVVLFAARLRNAMEGSPRRLQRFREASGALFIALGAGVIVFRRPAS